MSNQKPIVSSKGIAMAIIAVLVAYFITKSITSGVVLTGTSTSIVNFTPYAMGIVYGIFAFRTDIRFKIISTICFAIVPLSIIASFQGFGSEINIILLSGMALGTLAGSGAWWLSEQKWIRD